MARGFHNFRQCVLLSVAMDACYAGDVLAGLRHCWDGGRVVHAQGVEKLESAKISADGFGFCYYGVAALLALNVRKSTPEA